MPSRDRRPIAIHLPGLGRDSVAGGAERVAVTLASEFARSGRPTDLVLSVVHPGPLRDLPPEVRVVDLASRRLWNALPGLVAYRWRERPIVMLSLMPLANALNVLSAALGPCGARTAVISEHNARSIALDRAFDAEGTRLLHPVCRVTYPRASAIIGCSEGVAARIRAAYPMTSDRVAAIPNPVAAATARETGPPHPWLGDTTVPVILSVGRLHVQKDPDVFLRTVSRVRERRPVRALMLGDGPLRDEVEAAIERFGLSGCVEVLGHVPNPRTYMAWADVLLHTARWEGFGLVLVEAMAEALPVVATDCPTGPREVLGAGDLGRLAPIGDVDGLAAAVLATLAGPRDAARLRAHAGGFAPEVVARSYLAVLDEAAA